MDKRLEDDAKYLAELKAQRFASSTYIPTEKPNNLTIDNTNGVTELAESDLLDTEYAVCKFIANANLIQK